LHNIVLVGYNVLSAMRQLQRVK